MNLEFFFKPRSVAVIGASREPRKFGHVIFKNFVESEFQGKTFPVNPKADKILGFKAYTSISEIQSELDLAVIAVPAPIVPSVIDECVSKGVKAAIIISGGFKEVGERGEKLEEEIRKKIDGSGMRVIGPNCIGIYDPTDHVDTLFLPRYRLRRPRGGPIAFISQSGAFGSAILDWAASQDIGISKFISIGNKIDVDEVDLLNYLSDDPLTKCIVIYVESISRGREFLEASSKITKSKPLIVLKGGVTQEGARAAMSHTGSLAGSAKIYEGAFKQSGVIQARTVDELFDYARALAYQPIPKGQKDIAIITNGGGFGVISSDQASKLGLKLAHFSPETTTKLKEKLPDYAIPNNPLDLVGDADVERYRQALDLVSSDPNVGIILVIVLLQTSYIESDVVDAITESQVTYGKPTIVCTIGGDFTQILVKMLEENRIPSYTTPERAVNAINALLQYSKALEDIEKRNM
ncbi:MAG: CoA-binding protein [Nitrososphaeria archaeon]|jgi:acetyl coenzyme A synthetase (ADP forming)-like protein